MDNTYYQRLFSDLGLDKVCLTLAEQDIMGVTCRDGHVPNVMKTISIYDTDGDGKFDLLRLEIANYTANPHTITLINIDVYGSISLEKCEEELNKETFGCKLLLSLTFGVNRSAVLNSVMAYLNPEILAKTIREYGIPNVVKAILSDITRSVINEINENTTKALLEPLPVASGKAIDKSNKMSRTRGLKLFDKG